MDPEKMTQEDIEAAFDDFAQGKEPEISSEPEPAAEPPAEIPVEPEQPVTPPEEPEPSEPVVDEADILKSQLAEMENRAKHWERVAGNHGGKIGYLEKRLAEIEAAGRGRSEPAPEFSDEPRVEAVPKDYDAIKTWAVSQAVAAGAQQFMSEYKDAGEYQADIGAYLQANNYDPAKTLLTNDPVEAQRETKRVLEEAYFQVRANKEATRRQQLVEKRAEQMAKITEAKKKAAVSAPAATAAPPPRPKTYDDMSKDELDAELAKLTGGRW